MRRWNDPIASAIDSYFWKRSRVRVKAWKASTICQLCQSRSSVINLRAVCFVFSSSLRPGKTRSFYWRFPHTGCPRTRHVLWPYNIRPTVMALVDTETNPWPIWGFFVVQLCLFSFSNSKIEVIFWHKSNRIEENNGFWRCPLHSKMTQVKCGICPNCTGRARLVLDCRLWRFMAVASLRPLCPMHHSLS